MGSGIAQVAAQSGYSTILFDLNPEVVEKARASIYQQWEKLLQKGKISGETQAAAQNNLRFTHLLQDCKADLIIEAIVEKLEVKVSLFQQLAAINNSDTILASNTSSLSVSDIAASIPHPERFAGMHFFNPAPLMKLVEIVRAKHSSQNTISILTDLTRSMGKIPVVCKDAPGFIVNRVARPYYIESLRLVEEKRTTYAQLDRLLTNAGFKMGPFELMDLIGHDVNYAVSNSVYNQMSRPERLKPSPLQEALVQQGKLGKKSGEGFYKYER